MQKEELEFIERGQVFAMLLLTVVLCAAVYALIRTLGIGV